MKGRKRRLSWVACCVAAVALARPLQAQPEIIRLDEALTTAVGAYYRQKTPATLRQLALVHDERNSTTLALQVLDEGLKRWPNDPGLLAAKGRIYIRLFWTSSAEQALVVAAKAPAFAAEAQYYLGRIYFFKGYLAENYFGGWHEEVANRPKALAAFTAARDRNPAWYLPHIGLGDIAKAEGRDADAAKEYAEAKRLGQPAVDRERENAAVAAILAAQQSQEWAGVIDRGRQFVELFRYSPRLLEVQDALLAAYLATPTASAEDVRAAVNARIALRPDPMGHAAGANVLLARRVDLARVATIAAAGRAAGERFVHENESSYKLDGKVQGSLDRNAATFADITGWASFQQGDAARAEERLAEAERLSRGVDPVNQMHLGELSRTKPDLDVAKEHYLNVLGLAAAPPPMRAAATQALRDIDKENGEDAATFEPRLAATLDRRRDERRKTLLSAMAGKPVPPLKLVDLQGHPVDLEAERGNVILLNFFSAW